MSKRTWEAGRHKATHRGLSDPPRETAQLAIPRLPKAPEGFYRRDLLVQNGSKRPKLHELWAQAFLTGGESALEEMKRQIANGTYGVCLDCLQILEAKRYRQEALNVRRARLKIAPLKVNDIDVALSHLSWADLCSNPPRTVCMQHEVENYLEMLRKRTRFAVMVIIRQF